MLTRTDRLAFLLSAASLVLPLTIAAPARGAPAESSADNAGLTLPPGFHASVFADHIGHARHVVVSADNTVYVNTWSGPYYGQEPPRKGGFLVALRDNHGGGHADFEKRFGPGVAEHSWGGTGIDIAGEWLYAEVAGRIVRWPLKSGEAIPRDRPRTLVSGLPLSGEHPMHPFVVDTQDHLFVSVGAASNACEVKLDVPQPKVLNPCTELNTRGGVWQFSASQPGQKFSSASRYATGIRNIGGLRMTSAGELWVSQHGRDSLAQNWPALYSIDEGAELPAEELLSVRAGGDYGWPICYFDGSRGALVLAPEYGGDGKKVGECAQKIAPIAFFPAHWAPNDFLIYQGHAFPAAYRSGVFVAFHGSWNRAPRPQAGYKIVFQPMLAGKVSGAALPFADGFAGTAFPDGTGYRPAGLAQGPDGALYVTDDIHGRVWRITYIGPAAASVAAAPAPVYREAADPTATTGLALAKGVTEAQLTQGARIFHGQTSGGTCSGCHGVKGVGGGMAPKLTAHRWIWSDGSLAGIEATVRAGVTQAKTASGAMPPRGGAPLTDDDVAAVAAYVWALSHPTR